MTGATLLDQVLPRCDVRVRHAALFRVPADEAFRAALGLDVLRHPLARVLIGVRALPLGGTGPRTLRIADLAGPSLGWSVLAERPGAELVLATLARPWRVAAPPPVQPAGVEEFAAFATPGFVKIVLGVWAVAQGPAAAVLTVETRVAATDAASGRRFRRYWRFVGPFSELIRRTALGMLARELDPAARNSGEIVIARPVETVFDAVADERTEPRYNPGVRDVELLTPEPLGVGTRFRAQAVTAGRTAPMTIACTGYDRPHRFDSTTRMAAMDIDYTLTFEAVGDTDRSGTRLRWLFDLHPHGVLRPLRPLLAGLGRRRERRNWTALRDYLEADAMAGHRREPTRAATRLPGGSADRGGPMTTGSGLSRTERLTLLLEYEGNKRLRRLGAALYRRSSGQVGPRGRDVLLLTTRGRRSGREHTVLLQFFPDREGLVVVAANSGRPALPDWYRNLMAGPPSAVEVGARRTRVRPVELGADEAATVWPRILRRAPSYDRYLRAAGHTFPLVRLVAVEPLTTGCGAPQTCP